VSEIPLFSLVLIAMVVFTLRAAAAPSRATLWGVAITHGLALWTYYLAPFAILAALVMLALMGSLPRRVLRWALSGALAGAPSLVIAAVVLFRDLDARATANRHPDLAWGAWSPEEMLAEEISRSAAAIGGATLLVSLLAFVLACQQRRPAAAVPWSMFAIVTVAVAALSPVARVKPYYVLCVVPLALLALAAIELFRGRAAQAAVAALAVLAVVHGAGVTDARILYVPDAAAVMPRYARLVRDSGVRTVITVAHYDATLLAYELAREAGVSLHAALDGPVARSTVCG